MYEADGRVHARLCYDRYNQARVDGYQRLVGIITQEELRTYLYEERNRRILVWYACQQDVGKWVLDLENQETQYTRYDEPCPAPQYVENVEEKCSSHEFSYRQLKFGLWVCFIN
uniref:Uncharacterized protein n=1 Tax=Onchocerca volvulus TaxID=6282 RepID=A0A8R1TIV5_ONCVO